MAVDHEVKTEKKEEEEDVTSAGSDKKTDPWKKPTLEDVSGKVMAQPYIRFT